MQEDTTIRDMYQFLFDSVLAVFFLKVRARISPDTILKIFTPFRLLQLQGVYMQ